MPPGIGWRVLRAATMAIEPSGTAASAGTWLARRRAVALACSCLLGNGIAWPQRLENVTANRQRPGNGRVIAVGPNRDVRSIAQAARLAQDGDMLEVDAGDYAGDVAVWPQDRLEIRALGGRVRLLADGRAAEGKAIWVVRGGDLIVDGIDFIGARVPDRNGAGIRVERGRLALRNCGFFDNENGILAANDPGAEIEISGCEFGRNGFGDGFSHNLYVNQIRRLTISGSYFHHARIGHLIKTRAFENHVLYNRLTDEDGTASYELEFPNGGFARVVGNIIQQSAKTDNPVLVSFGAEGYGGRRSAIYLVHNTLIDERSDGGIFLRVRDGDRLIFAANNLALGPGQLERAGAGTYLNNHVATVADFADAARFDFRLRRMAVATGKAIILQSPTGVDLALQKEYVHHRQTQTFAGIASHPGAMQTLVA